MNLDVYQQEIALWRKSNFPDSGEDEQFLGIVEEVGELAHAILKQRQGIRERGDEDIIDAIGDIMIYLLNYCSCKGWSLDGILWETWDQVKRRDWRENKLNGEVTNGEERCDTEVPEPSIPQGSEFDCAEGDQVE
jgi:NTP pyrophosphatase (non-canonical NTP hydrolase)